MSAGGAAAGPRRHELPEIDEAALAAARHADRVLEAAKLRGASRWEAFLAPLPDRLRDDPPAELRAVVRRARAAYGPKDSIADALPEDLVLPFRDALDRLAKALARWEASAR